MKSKKIIILLFILIFGIAYFVRIYKLSQIPAGVFLDEASLGYNAYSLLLTGKDEYGKVFPLLLRSFATFQSPLYSYLSTIPVYFLSLSIFSTRLLSVISGMVVVLATFLLFYLSNLKSKSSLALIAATLVAFSPWSIFVSRVAVEANLGLALTTIAILLLALSLKKRWCFILSCLVFSFSGYAYHANRIIGILLPLAFLFINRKTFFQSKKWVIIGLVLFLLIQTPNIVLLAKPGSMGRFQTQGYIQKSTFEKYGGSLAKLPVLGWPLYIARQFTSQYLSDFSPRSLFFEPEPQLVRSIPNLSVFYMWMIIPFFIGFAKIWKEKSNSLIQIIFLVIIIGPLPEALTGDPFYTLRMLAGIWGMTLMIAFGVKVIFHKLKYNYVKILLAALLIVISGLNFYISYFILLKHERSIWYGYPFEVLAQMTEENKNQTFILDSEIYDAPYIWMAFYKKYDPAKLQRQTPDGLLDHYYDDLTFYKYRVIDNVQVRKINWGVDQCKDEYIVGDLTAVSASQARDHRFTLVREIKDLNDKTILWVYHTNPQLKCGNGIDI